MQKRIEIEIVDGRPQTRLTNMERHQALALLQSAIDTIHVESLESLGVQITRSQHQSSFSDNVAPAIDTGHRAATLVDLITRDQMRRIEQLARDLAIDESKECKRLMDCEIIELSRSSADILIEELRRWVNNPTLRQ